MSTPLSDSADHTANSGFVYGHSPTIQTVNAVVGEIARTDIPVLLMGESGTGKEVYGRFIHRMSKKGHAPLRKLNCRDRREDILPLTEHFLTKYAAELGRKVPALSDKQAGLLARHGWPGNIRELENLARKIVVLGDARKAMDEVPEMPKAALSVSRDPRCFSLKVAARAASRQAERDLISKVLEWTHWNRKRAAQQLQISYKSLLYKIKRTGLEGKQRETGVKERQ